MVLLMMVLIVLLVLVVLLVLLVLLVLVVRLSQASVLLSLRPGAPPYCSACPFNGRLRLHVGAEQEQRQIGEIPSTSGRRQDHRVHLHKQERHEAPDAAQIRGLAHWHQ